MQRIARVKQLLEQSKVTDMGTALNQRASLLRAGELPKLPEAPAEGAAEAPVEHVVALAVVPAVAPAAAMPAGVVEAL